MEQPRIIPLRRPPQLSVLEGRFVPQTVPLDHIERAWQELLKRVPRAFDGPLLHVMGTSRNGHGGVQLHCVESSYRFYAVTKEGVDAGMRPLGVKGICLAEDGSVLMARRSAHTLHYPRQWEFAPGGTLEPGVTPSQMLLRELKEETGWRALSPPVARALLYDPVVRSWEVVFSVRAAPPDVAVEGWECDELRLVQPGQWPEPMSAVSRQMLPLVRSLLHAR